MRILFMGSPKLAIPSLKAVVESGNVVGVITQPPKASGRGRTVTPSPISNEAESAGLSVMTPAKLKDPELERSLAELRPDIAVVVAYGKILPPTILAIPKLGCVNVHASMLPDLRGAAPIQWAIARGYQQTGVTLMQMDEGMDTGPILLQMTTPIGPEETAGELGERLSHMGADLLREALPLLERGELNPVEQDHSQASYAPLLTKEDGFIDWTLSARKIADRIRGFSPWPGTYTVRAGSRFLITRAKALDENHRFRPGTIMAADYGCIKVACGEGKLDVLAVKPEGKREMDVQEFLAGHKIEPGEVLGS